MATRDDGEETRNKSICFKGNATVLKEKKKKEFKVNQFFLDNKKTINPPYSYTFYKFDLSVLYIYDTKDGDIR